MVNQLTSGPLAAYWENSVMVRLVKNRTELIDLILLFPKLACERVTLVHGSLLGSVHCPSSVTL